MSESAIAVVGTGYIGVEHVKAIEGNPAARLHTICSTPRSEDAAQSLGDIHSAEKVTTCFSDVIENPEVDTVYLCTPNSQHVAQAVAALDVGKHLFVEKPLAVTVAEKSGAKRMASPGPSFRPGRAKARQDTASGSGSSACSNSVTSTAAPPSRRPLSRLGMTRVSLRTMMSPGRSRSGKSPTR